MEVVVFNYSENDWTGDRQFTLALMGDGWAGEYQTYVELKNQPDDFTRNLLGTGRYYTGDDGKLAYNDSSSESTMDVITELHKKGFLNVEQKLSLYLDEGEVCKFVYGWDDVPIDRRYCEITLDELKEIIAGINHYPHQLCGAFIKQRGDERGVIAVHRDGSFYGFEQVEPLLTLDELREAKLFLQPNSVGNQVGFVRAELEDKALEITLGDIFINAARIPIEHRA